MHDGIPVSVLIKTDYNFAITVLILFVGATYHSFYYNVAAVSTVPIVTIVDKIAYIAIVSHV